MDRDFREIGRQLSNWSRWGPDDERGTTNFITSASVRRAAQLIRKGEVFDLGIPFGTDGPQNGSGGRINPVHIMTELGTEQRSPGAFRYADDYVFMPLQAASQWDALAHVMYDGKMYNGFPAESVTTWGAERCSIDKQGRGIVGRGVLLDVARHRGVEWLAREEVVKPGELDDIAAAAGVSFDSGDILLIRTGWRKKYLVEKDPASFRSGSPGLGVDCCEWLAGHEIAALCSDNLAVEVAASEVAGETLPLHMILIRDMGMTLGELLDFEALAEDCALDGVYEFFFCGPPIKFAGAVGSPINPLAIK